MAISTTFNSATIFKPGAYSKSTIDLSGGFPLGPSGLVAVIGEADAGTPGALEVDLAQNNFVGEQLVQLRSKYRSGPIADAASMLFAPAADAAVPGGAQVVWVYKTNNSTRASLEIEDDYGTLRAREYGVGGNRVTLECIMIAEAGPSVASLVGFDETALNVGDSIFLWVNGQGPNEWTVPVGGIADNAALAVELADAANWSAGLPADVDIEVSGSNGASIVSIAAEEDLDAHKNGWGKSLQLSAGVGSALADMGLASDMAVSAVEPSASLVIRQKRDGVSESDEVGGNVVISLGREIEGGLVSAEVSVTATAIELKENGVTAHSFPKASYATLADLVEDINMAVYAGWTAAVSDPLYNQLNPRVLDQVEDIGALAVDDSKPARLKKDADDVASLMELSDIVLIDGLAAKGLPDPIGETPLAGGTRGSTSSADIVAALEKFEKFHVNFIVPLFARDAAADIADGLTDSGSTYMIEGIHQAVKTHISLMKTTKRRSERQAVLALKAPYVDCKSQAGVMADARIQLVFQDARQQDAQGGIRWFQPWATAALLAGARCGAPIGEPMTFKNLNLLGIRHTAQPMTTAEENIQTDFDPDLQTDDAIKAGLTFLEAPQDGGFRVVVDNTTYTRDANFVFNRANVLYAGDIVAREYRIAMERRFVGRKNTVSIADIESFASTILTGFLNQGITVSTADAPSGFKDLIARLEGNTIRTEKVIKLVEGIDFVLSEIFIQRAES